MMVTLEVLCYDNEVIESETRIEINKVPFYVKGDLKFFKVIYPFTQRDGINASRSLKSVPDYAPGVKPNKFL